MGMRRESSDPLHRFSSNRPKLILKMSCGLPLAAASSQESGANETDAQQNSALGSVSNSQRSPPPTPLPAVGSEIAPKLRGLFTSSPARRPLACLAFDPSPIKPRSSSLLSLCDSQANNMREVASQSWTKSCCHFYTSKEVQTPRGREEVEVRICSCLR